MHLNRAIAAVLVIGFCTAIVGAQATKPMQKIRLGHDTTRILKPLKADGTPDYLAALNKRYAKGVTKDNNAAILILRALGPDMLPEKIRPAILKTLGMKLPADGQYFVDFDRDHKDAEKAYDWAFWDPWQASDHPAVAKWLTQNKAPLDTFVAASKRSRYYMPLAIPTKDAMLMGALLPSFGQVRASVRALIIRANLAMGAWDVDEAWADILAVYRLGVLMGQDQTVIGHLVGVSVQAYANMATARLATWGGLSVGDARVILSDMGSLGATPDMFSAIDTAERFMLLDALVSLARPKNVSLEELQRALRDMDPEIKRMSDKDWEKFIKYKDIHLNDILRRANRHYDEIVAAMKLPTFRRRQQAYAQLREKLRKLKHIAANPTLDQPEGTESLETRQAGTWVLALLLPDLSRSRTLADRARVQRELTVLAVALAVHKAEAGAYPAKLAALAPKYVKAVPQDFFSGKPLIYKREGEGYLLYSVGENARDDGGKDDVSTGDIVIRAEK